MKKTSNKIVEQKIKNVIILGAGASKSEGAPLQNELISEFFKLLKKKELPDKPEKNNDENYYNIVKDYFEKFWRITIENFDPKLVPTFEECLGVLDLAYLRGECFKECSKEKITKYKEALIFSIAKTLKEKLKGNRRKGFHDKLIENLIKDDILKETTFISLNYDIIIDNALLRKMGNYSIDYGIPFINYKSKHNFNRGKERYWEKPKEGKSVLLLKPHGSLNWLYCPICNSMNLTPKRKGGIEAFYTTEKCNECNNTKMEPVIIPPTFYKDMSNPFIQQIYLKADEVLRHAENIFICGYSFSNADMHIKYLLKRAEIFKGTTPNIYVINNYEGKSEDKIDDEMTRIKRFFKNKENIKDTKLSFKEFAEKGLVLTIDENK